MTDIDIETIYRRGLSNSLTAALRAVFDAGITSTQPPVKPVVPTGVQEVYDGLGKSISPTPPLTTVPEAKVQTGSPIKVKAAGGDTRSFAERMKTKK